MNCNKNTQEKRAEQLNGKRHRMTPRELGYLKRIGMIPKTPKPKRTSPVRMD